MTDTIIELSEDEFAAQYPLRTNHLNPTATWAFGEGGGCLFETYGEELAFVRRQDPRTVWSLIDDGGGDQCLLSGFHLVNRIGYLISTVPVPEGIAIQVHIPSQNEGDADDTPHTPEPWGDNADGVILGNLDAYAREAPIVAVAEGYDEFGNASGESIANTRRIVAAINACKRIDTKALEGGIIDDLLSALKEARKEIEHWHSDMLTPEERRHPRGSGWARVHDRISAALIEATGRAA